MLGTLRDSFVGNVSRWPDRTAIIGSERTYTYAELNEAVNRCANFLLGLGVKKGDAVGLLLNNYTEFAIGFLACQKIGAISSHMPWVNDFMRPALVLAAPRTPRRDPCSGARLPP